MQYGWEWFIDQFEKISKIDLTAYKRPQMERRINSFMRSASVPDYKFFIELLKNDHVIYRKFLDHLTINVSEFFRNANHWEILEKEIMPELYKSKTRLRVWSAGSSTGEEPYSLAMLFKEKFGARVEKILASDIDKEVLEKASIALYNEKSINTLPNIYRQKYVKNDGAFFRIADEIKLMVNFQQHDLLKDSYPKEYDLILCRNVVIYFTEETKQKLYQKFAAALRSGGILFIGSTEQIFQARELGLKSIATFFYQKQ